MWPDDIVPLLHRKVNESQPNDWIILANSFFHILDNPFVFVPYCKLIKIFLNIILKYVSQKESLTPERPLQRSVAASWLRQGRCKGRNTSAHKKYSAAQSQHICTQSVRAE